ncbi:MAG: sulfatase-like hydrolase/transferase [Anaerolineae bacterium]|nr:sulfatase-like hydrolase/transferase [Anaerolineae bacterium]
MPERPNILCIMSDEHDPGVTGCYGDPWVATPHLDRLAQRGVTFDACYTTSPLCVPARLSFTAGQYISRVGAWSNNSWLPSDEIESLPRLLGRAGYECWLGGKMHYDATRRYGFRDLFATNQNGSHKTGSGRRRAPDDHSVNHESWRNRSAQFRVGDESQVIALDVQVTRECGRFLRERAADAPPFFLLAGYLAPHFPLIVPRAYHAPYAGRVPMPDLPEGALESLPLNYQHLRWGFGLVDATPEQTRIGRELYWGFVSWLDAEIGQLLAALDDSAVAENTLVIYTSDHGENKGDHGLWWKNNMFEHAARIPLIVSWPARWAGGQRRLGACSLVDLVQTIAQLGGAETPDNWDGDSMVAWLDDPGIPWKDLAVSEYYAHNIASGYAMLRQGRFKYVHHTDPGAGYGSERELYDLSADPGEFHNLAEDPAQSGRVAIMHAALLAELGRDPDETEQLCRADYARGYAR